MLNLFHVRFSEKFTTLVKILDRGLTVEEFHLAEG